jgi:hypothetical protein
MHRPSLRHSLDGILHHVEEYLLELITVRIHQWEFGRHVAGYFNMFVADRKVQQFQYFLDKVGERNQARNQVARARIIDDLIDNLVEPVSFHAG